jgi:hypothetical protein
MGKLTRKYKKKNSRTKSMKKHKVSKKSRKSRKQLKKGGMKKTFTPSENSAFRPISWDDIETGKTGISNNPKSALPSFSLDEYDVESGTPIPRSLSGNTSITPNTTELLHDLPNPPYISEIKPVFQKVEQKIFIPGEQQIKISSKSPIESDIHDKEEKEEILYENKNYNDYLQKYPPDPNIPPPLNYEDYIKTILIPEKGIKYVKYGIQLYTLPNTNRVYDNKGNLYTEEDIKNLKIIYDETPFIDTDDLIEYDIGIGIYKNKNNPLSPMVYDKNGYLLNKDIGNIDKI